MTARELFIGSADGTRLRVIGDSVRILAAGADTGGAFEVFEMNCPRDSGPPPHAHPWSESYSVVDGSLDVTIGEKTITAAAGCFFHIPAGTVHSHRITSAEARFVIVTSPAGAADFFTELDRETAGSPGDMETIAGIAQRHGFAFPR